MATIFLFFLLLFSNCFIQNKPENPSVFDLLFLATAQNTVFLNGKVTTGRNYIINGRVIVTPLSVNGTCDKTASGSSILAETTTGTSGNYSITFARNNTPICVITIPNSVGTSYLYDEKYKKTVPWSNSNYYVQAVLVEPSTKISDHTAFSTRSTNSNRLNLTPLTRIASQRMSVLLGSNRNASNLSSSVSLANRLATFRFNLRVASQAVSSKKVDQGIKRLLSSSITASSISEATEITDLDVNLDDPANPITKQMNLLLSGFSQLASQSKSTNQDISGSNYESIIKAFEDDFSDGTFDGKKNSKVLVIDTPEQALPLGSDPLKTTLKGAIKDFLLQSGSNATEDLALLNNFTFYEAGSEEGEDLEPNELTIFISTDTYTGSLGGFSGADSLCNTDPNKPFDATYKALLFGNNALTPDNFYFTEDNNGDFYTVSGYTNQSSQMEYIDENDVVYPDELFESIGFDPDEVWYGDSGANRCVNWTSSSGAQNGQYGTADEYDTNWYDTGFDTCDQEKYLYCVEQP